MFSRASTFAALVLTLVAAVPLAGLGCGGGTPAPKDEDTASTKSGDDSSGGSGKAKSASDSSSAAAPDDSAPPAATPPPAATAAASSSGDIKLANADDPWMASHQVSAKDVSKTMRAAQGKVQACFKAGLKRDPSTNGDVKLKFVIANDGTVRAWKDDASSMSDGDVTQCVGDTLNKLKFPKQKSPGDAWGTYTVHFGN